MRARCVEESSSGGARSVVRGGFRSRGQGVSGQRGGAPVDGVVAYVEDEHPDIRPQRFFRKPNVRSPAGNYVSIQVKTCEAKRREATGAEGAAVYVLLCHLQWGSLRVGVGATVRVGDVVGLCGNSGNTSRPHLHIHAQDRARIAVGVAQGLPLRFDRGAGGSEWLEPGRVFEV